MSTLSDKAFLVVCLVAALQAAWFVASERAAAIGPPAGRSYEFDFGSMDEQPADGYTRVAIEDTYPGPKRYGVIYSKGAAERGWRKRGLLEDRRLDTFVFDDGGLTFVCELPNGRYLLSLASGCAQYSGKASVTINGRQVAPLTCTRPGEFLMVERWPVSVPDGRLRVQIGGFGRLNFLTIEPAADVASGGAAANSRRGRIRLIRPVIAQIEHILPEGEYAVDRDAYGPIVRVNLERIRNWTAVPGVKRHWLVLGPSGQRSAGHAIRSEIRDVDRDGVLDLFRFLQIRPQAVLARFDEEGNEIWHTDPLPAATGDESGLPVEDLDGDGRFECVASLRGAVYCIDADNGSIKWQAATASDGPEKDASMAVGHFASREQYGVAVRAGMTVFCFDCRGQTVWTHKLNAQRYHWYGHELHPHDIDSDGYDEVFVGLNRTTLVLDHGGKLLWEDRTQRNHTDFFQFGDIDDDGHIEVAYDHDGCGGRGPIVVADARTGRCKLQIDYRKVGIGHAQCLAIGDFCPDRPGLELALTDKSCGLALWSARGRLLWKRDAPASLVTRTDWDGDGVLDLAVMTVGKNQDPSFSVWNGDGERLYAISWLPLPLRSFTAVCSREEAQHVQPDLDGNGRADVLVAFGPWDFGRPQHLVLLESDKKEGAGTFRLSGHP